MCHPNYRYSGAMWPSHDSNIYGLLILEQCLRLAVCCKHQTIGVYRRLALLDTRLQLRVLDAENGIYGFKTRVTVSYVLLREKDKTGHVTNNTIIHVHTFQILKRSLKLREARQNYRKTRGILVWAVQKIASMNFFPKILYDKRNESLIQSSMAKSPHTNNENEVTDYI